MHLCPSRNGLWSPFGIETKELTTVALLERKEEASPPGSPKTQRLRQVSLQSLSRVLQHGHGQVVGRSKTQGVAMVADMPMRPPGPSRDAPLMMSCEAAQFSHKAKRGLLRQPGKPLRGIWLKREQPLLGADHDVASFWPILDARDDMSRLAGRLGCATRAGSRRCGLGWTLGRPGRLRRSQRDGGPWPVLRDEAGEISHLLLQRDDLGLQGAQRLGERQERSRQRRRLAGFGGRRLLWQGSQAALMQAGQCLQVLAAHPFFAAIVGMAAQGKLSLGQPAVQRFDINAQAASSLGQRDEGHRATPFVWNGQPEREPLWQSPGSFPRRFVREKGRETCQENSQQDSQDCSWQERAALLAKEKPRRARKRLSRLSGGGGDGNSRPNIEGFCATTTTDR